MCVRKFNIEVDFNNGEELMLPTTLEVVHETDSHKADTMDVLKLVRTMLDVVISEAENGHTNATIVSHED